MTEKEWMNSPNPRILLGRAQDTANARRLRLFACACARCAWHLLTDERSRNAVAVAEQYADSLADDAWLASAWEAAKEAVPSTPHARHEHPELVEAARAAAMTAMSNEDFISPPADEIVGDWLLTERVAHWIAVAVEHEAYAVARRVCRTLGKASRSSAAKHRAEERKQADLLRDIFGNRFRPVSFSSSWCTDTALSLARQMYDSRDFGATPILADALQDAGCEDGAILNHCRDANQVHVRGCWVVDLVLGKS